MPLDLRGLAPLIQVYDMSASLRFYRAYLELCAKGIAVKPPQVAPYGMKQMYFRDPDGYALCFQWRSEPVTR
jgi:hypothetical protein